MKRLFLVSALLSSLSAFAELPPKDPASVAKERQEILDHYRNVDPQHLIPQKLLTKAILEFHKRQKEISNQRYVTVIDYSKPSTEKRFFIVDMKSGAVWRTYVANGKGTEARRNGRASSFGNDRRSHRSSIGVFMTRETYTGKHGYSLKLDGLSATNSNARSRAIVVHGANYVQDKAVVQGRSYGCPAIPMKYRTKVIDMIKGGSLILAATEK